MSIWKKIAYGFGALIALILVVVSVVYGMSDVRFRETHTVKTDGPALSSDSAVPADGAHVASTMGCADCRSDEVARTSGRGR